jgi:hypothetical protein
MAAVRRYVLLNRRCFCQPQTLLPALIGPMLIEQHSSIVGSSHMPQQRVEHRKRYCYANETHTECLELTDRSLPSDMA